MAVPSSKWLRKWMVTKESSPAARLQSPSATTWTCSCSGLSLPEMYMHNERMRMTVRSGGRVMAGKERRCLRTRGRRQESASGLVSFEDCIRDRNHMPRHANRGETSECAANVYLAHYVQAERKRQEIRVMASSLRHHQLLSRTTSLVTVMRSVTHISVHPNTCHLVLVSHPFLHSTHSHHVSVRAIRTCLRMALMSLLSGLRGNEEGTE